MTYPRLALAPKTHEEAHRLYEQTLVPVIEIAKMLGMSPTTLRKYAKTHGWRRRSNTGAKPALVATARRKRIDDALAATAEGALPSCAATAPPSDPVRTALVARIQGAVEREIAAVEAILTTLSGEANAAPDEAERAARTLASLARTLSELTRIECAASESRNAPADDAQEDIPRDLDELRSALSRKLESFIAGRHSPLSGES